MNEYFPKSSELQKYMEYCHRLAKHVPVNKYGELKGLPPDVRQDLRRFMKRIDRLDTSAVEKRRLRWWIVTIRNDIIELENIENG